MKLLSRQFQYWHFNKYFILFTGTGAMNLLAQHFCVQPISGIFVPEQPDRTWLCTHVTQALKAVRCGKSFGLHSKKFFVSYIISRVRLDHQALGPNCWMVIFR